ncbi:restriction endonuclease [Micromonospora sp. NPDC047793]|uniref:restriction endonuclease n=1 Tax=Micromonospora sp. NPDC047793 TaxID=3154342 RepID=UPI0033CA2261
MRLSMDGTVRSPRFPGRALNRQFGKSVARLSDDDAQAVLLRYAEVQTATKIRRRWLQQGRHISESSAPNLKYHKLLAAKRGWPTVAEEVQEYLHADQANLAREALLAAAHVALCDKVIAELVDGLVGDAITDAYRADTAQDRSPLRHLASSIASAQAAEGRSSAADDGWIATLKAFEAEEQRRASYAQSDASSGIDKFDTATGTLFERWIAWLLQRDGCIIEREHGGKDDQGADVIALTPGRRRIVLQCKQSTNPQFRVRPPCVRELNGTARQEHGADIVGIATNRTLSEAARQFAARHQIHVIDRPVLIRWATYGVSWLPTSGPRTAAA